jgi:hypothetical protein
MALNQQAAGFLKQKLLPFFKKKINYLILSVFIHFLFTKRWHFSCSRLPRRVECWEERFPSLGSMKRQAKIQNV